MGSQHDTPETPVQKVDYIVVGSGVAGLYTAIHLAGHGQVTVLSKQDRLAGNTWFAQGGIAAALGEEDSPKLHLEDTWEAGVRFGDRRAIAVMVEEAPRRIEELIKMGIPFDRRNGCLDLGREGAHSRKRILHIGGDATGRELVEALLEQAGRCGIKFVENAFVTGLLVGDEGCRGVVYHDEHGRTIHLHARAVILATGGCGQLFLYTTNAPPVTGDGLALAYYAGAVLTDLEFFQFHPTVFFPPQSDPFLISEAVRGEGAYLINKSGRRFMERYHPRGELGPRDVVARAILKEKERAGGEVYLDLRHLGAEFVRGRFPTIYSRCREWGLDITRDIIPVSPAAHYLIGGIRVDLDGKTGVPRLFAVGEVASTGVHGANRLASNSLLEGLVFGYRAAAAARATDSEPTHTYSAPRLPMVAASPAEESTCADLRPRCQQIMWEKVGLSRNRIGLEAVQEELGRWRYLLERRFERPVLCENRNMLLVALLMSKAALQRNESRGAHFREDFPYADPALDHKHFSWSGGII